MFTGLIETTGLIKSIKSQNDYKILSIAPTNSFNDLKMGESIAIDGTCLTVTGFDDNSFTVEASHETANRTILGEYRVNSRVNLERAMKLGDRMGGHLVSGHIDNCGKIIKFISSGRSIEIAVEYNDKYSSLVIEKGSIALNGISLTINSCDKNSLSVNIIPHTADQTTVGEMKSGQLVNLEFDMIGKYVSKMNQNNKPKQLTKKKLLESGW